jgi:hypothetical protein
MRHYDLQKALKHYGRVEKLRARKSVRGPRGGSYVEMPRYLATVEHPGGWSMRVIWHVTRKGGASSPSVQEVMHQRLTSVQAVLDLVASKRLWLTGMPKNVLAWLWPGPDGYKGVKLKATWLPKAAEAAVTDPAALAMALDGSPVFWDWLCEHEPGFVDFVEGRA